MAMRNMILFSEYRGYSCGLNGRAWHINCGFSIVELVAVSFVVVVVSVAAAAASVLRRIYWRYGIKFPCSNNVDRSKNCAVKDNVQPNGSHCYGANL